MADKDLVVSELVLSEGDDLVGAIDPVGGFSSSAAIRGLMEGMEKKERQRCVKSMLMRKIAIVSNVVSRVDDDVNKMRVLS